MECDRGASDVRSVLLNDEDFVVTWGHVSAGGDSSAVGAQLASKVPEIAATCQVRRWCWLRHPSR